MKKIFVFLFIIIFLLTPFGCSKSKDTEPKNVKNSRDMLQTVQTGDGVQVVYIEKGPKDSEIELVFIHGWNEDKSYWNRQMTAFSDNFHVLSLDLPGHGASGSNRTNWTITSFADDVVSVIEKTGFRNVVLIGHAMGGTITLEVARKIPDKVKLCIGVEAFHSANKNVPEEERRRFLENLSLDYESNIAYFVKRRLFHSDASGDIVSKVLFDFTHVQQHQAFSILSAYLDFDEMSSLKNVSVPVVAINGDIMESDEDAGKKVNPRFSIKTIKNCGHFPMLEKPVEFNEILTTVIVDNIRVKHRE